jgi:hypothetical protein
MYTANHIESYCVGSNDISNVAGSNFYKGFQDAVAYINNNITDPSLSRGLDTLNYDLRNENGVCRKYGFEQGYALYHDARQKYKTDVLDKQFSITSILESAQQ